MSLFIPLLCCSSFLVGLQDPIPEEDLSLRVSASVEEVEFGKAFELTVVQVWDKGLELESWGSEKLAPLTVRLLETERREDDERIEETRRYECFAFEVDELTLPAMFLRAKSAEDGSQRVALGEGLRISVLSVLEDDDSGEMEMPREAFPAPFPWAIAVLVAMSALSVAIPFRRAFKRRPAVEVIAQPPPADEVARERLQRLREQPLQNRSQVRAFHVEASAIVRAYIGGRFRVQAPGKTTEEFFADPATIAALRPADRECLNAFLVQGDLVKYAAQASLPEERERLLASVEGFIEETREWNREVDERREEQPV